MRGVGDLDDEPRLQPWHAVLLGCLDRREVHRRAGRADRPIGALGAATVEGVGEIVAGVLARPPDGLAGLRVRPSGEILSEAADVVLRHPGVEGEHPEPLRGQIALTLDDPGELDVEVAGELRIPLRPAIVVEGLGADRRLLAGEQAVAELTERGGVVVAALLLRLPALDLDRLAADRRLAVGAVLGGLVGVLDRHYVRGRAGRGVGALLDHVERDDQIVAALDRGPVLHRPGLVAEQPGSADGGGDRLKALNRVAAELLVEVELEVEPVGGVFGLQQSLVEHLSEILDERRQHIGVKLLALVVPLGWDVGEPVLAGDDLGGEAPSLEHLRILGGDAEIANLHPLLEYRPALRGADDAVVEVLLEVLAAGGAPVGGLERPVDPAVLLKAAFQQLGRGRHCRRLLGENVTQRLERREPDAGVVGVVADPVDHVGGGEHPCLGVGRAVLAVDAVAVDGESRGADQADHVRRDADQGSAGSVAELDRIGVVIQQPVGDEVEDPPLGSDGLVGMAHRLSRRVLGAGLALGVGDPLEQLQRQLRCVASDVVDGRPYRRLGLVQVGVAARLCLLPGVYHLLVGAAEALIAAELTRIGDVEHVRGG